MTYKTGSGAPPRIDRTSRAGGPSAIAGFLFQILRSVQLGVRIGIAFTDGSPDQAKMLLTLEPPGGGDHRVSDCERVIVEQVKMRTGHRRWSSAEIAREVLPDLLKAAQPQRAQEFRFVTNNVKGLGPLAEFLKAFQSNDRPNSTSSLRWGRDRLSVPEYATRLAATAGVAVEDEGYRWLLANLTLEIIETGAAEAEIDGLLEPALAPGQRSEDKRHELISRLLQAASEGRSLDAADLLSMVHPDAYLRLAHARTLPDILARRLGPDCRALGYDPSLQARLQAVEMAAPVTILSGESGQGKTWSLCQAALTQTERGELAIVFRAPRTRERLEQEINERVWLCAYAEPVSPQVMARRLSPTLAKPEGYWLTVYLDDLQDRSFAEEIAWHNWQAHGIRVVVSAQPRIAEAMHRIRSDIDVKLIDNFTSAELRRYLRAHNRDAPLETMPDDVFELLLKPIHARVFTDLPVRPVWTGVTEYELFSSYWAFATSHARAQYDHPQDRERLLALAGSLLGSRPRYPWRGRDLGAASLDDEAIGRLEEVGLVRWIEVDRFVFLSDRMLNWAVAECLCARIADDAWSPAQCEQELDRLESIVTLQGEAIGRRLGYVFLDTLWLLTREMPSDFIADLLLARCRRLPHEWRGEGMWSKDLATVGDGLLPALEALALRSYDEERDWDIPQNIPFALAAVAEVDREAVASLTARLLASGDETGLRVALNTARRVSLPELLDPLWELHRAREVAFDRCDNESDERGERSRLLHDREVSSEAVRTAVASAPGWLDRRIANSRDSFELDLLLWILADERYVGDDQAREIWLKHRGHLLDSLPNESKALINALGHFRDVDNRALLDTVPLGREDWMSSRVLRSRARIDPVVALRQIRERGEDYGWSAAAWWLPDLARADPVGLSEAIRENAGKGDNPLTDLVLYYSPFPELIDEPTLELVLDQFADALAEFNELHSAEPDAQPGRLAHPLRFLPTLTQPWQLDCLARRAGTPLERELVRFATRRTGRTSRVRDIDGEPCERLLAMIGEPGFDALVVAELERPNVFGREDGYTAAHWTESTAVKSALLRDHPSDGDGYRQVIRMQALAIHQCDDALEAMVRAGAPIFVNAAEMRSADGRPTDTLRVRIERLIGTGNADELRVAAQLAGFLRDAEEVRVLLPCFLDPTTPDRAKRAMVASFNALRFYDSSMLMSALGLIEGRIDDEAQFVATYLASEGDAAARHAVADWLEALDIGTWSSSGHSFLRLLLDHDDSRPAAIAFLRRSRERGHLLIDSSYKRQLADAGDRRAHDELVRAAYRGPQFGDGGTATGILYLREQDMEEAFFAARRYLARHDAVVAIDLLLQIDVEQAAPLLVDKYRVSQPLLRAEIARRLRTYVATDRMEAIINLLANGSRTSDRQLAAELAGWMPPSTSFGWLDRFADDLSESVRSAARAALASRARETAAMAHVEAMSASSKPLRWARLQTVFESVDPHFLWSRNDPTSLGPMLDTSPPEFFVEAQQLRTRHVKKLADEARKAGRYRP